MTWSKPKFNPDTDIPDLAGKVIFITGGTGGLGAASAQHLARHNPAHIYISGRNAQAAEKVISQIRESKSTTGVTFVECDLSSLASVKQAAEKFAAQTPRLDILMCNAGIMARPPGLTVDGYEIQFGTNHVGHALLIRKLIPLLQRTAAEQNGDARIILLSSEAWFAHPSGGIIFDDLRTEQQFSLFGPWRRYGQSKLANLLYARELARHYPDITSVAIHPGVVATGLLAGTSLRDRVLVYTTSWFMMVSTQEGAYNQVWATTVDKPKIQNGQYYQPVGDMAFRKLDKTARDDDLAGRLWAWTEEALQGY